MRAIRSVGEVAMIDVDQIAALGFIVVDPRAKHRVAYGNRLVEQLTGPLLGQGRLMSDLLPEFDATTVQRMSHGVPNSSTSYLACRDGHLYEIGVDIVPVFDIQERLDFYVVILDLEPLSALLDPDEVHDS